MGDFFFFWYFNVFFRQTLRWLKSSVSTKSSLSSRWTRFHGALRKVEPVNHLLEVVSVRTGKKHFFFLSVSEISTFREQCLQILNDIQMLSIKIQTP